MASRSAQDLWERAFTQLEAEDAEVLKSNERQLAELNNILINKSLYEIKSTQWCVTLAGRSLKIRELGAKIINFVSSSQAYLSQVTSSEPHAALAWSCISLLLPLITNQSSQVEAMLAGLDEISYLIGFYTTWQDLYGARGSDKLRETVVRLYCAILTYQARMLHYLSRGSVNKFARDAIKKDAWEASLEEVRLRDKQSIQHGKLEDISQERQDRTYQASLLETQAGTTKHILDALNDINQQRLQQVQDGERQELIRCLSNNYRSQKDTNPERVKGTCEWFVKDERFTDWRSSQKSCLLHVFAGPGCGKSVLVRHLVDSGALKSSDNVTVLYFFFKAAQEGQESCANAIAAMLHQLYTQKHSEAMIVHALPRFRAHGNKLSAMFEELWDILQQTVEDSTAGEILCVFDALDECLEEDRGKLLKTVTKYFEDIAPAQTGGGRLKILITSRPYEDISIEYKCLKDGSPVVQLDGNDKIELIAKEINLVIDFAVPRVLPTASKEIQRAVIEQLQRMDSRTYLWLHLVLDHVKKNSTGKQTPGKIKKLISTLPATVNDAYTAMLHRSKDSEQARTLLHLVIAAKRPLTVSELKIAAALVESVEGHELYQDLHDETESAEQFKDSLQNICGLMLVVHDSRVYFIHQTAREYLCKEQFVIGHEQSRWKGPIVVSEADALTAECCVSLLHLKDFSHPQPWKEQALRAFYIGDHIDDWTRKYDFLEYAGVHWISHARNVRGVESQINLQQQIHLCSPSSNVFWAWYPIFCKSEYLNISEHFNGLAFASSVGHTKLAEQFLQNGFDVNSRDGTYGNALQAASVGGHDKTVQLLLDKGAEINTQGGFYGNALQATSEGGHDKTVQLLLDNGAEINAQGGHYGNALQAASVGGRDKTVQLLLDKGAEINTQGGLYGNALEAASVVGHDKTVQLLLDNGAMINAQGGFFGNALQATSAGGHDKTVQLLLDKGAEINTQGGFYGNALQAASEGGHDKTVQLLLDNGAEINAQGGHYGNALQAASEGGHDKIVQLLLDKGAEINTQGGDYGNALQATLVGGRDKTVQLLLDKGAEINTQGGLYGNALEAASVVGHDKTVQLLLDNGAMINAQGGFFGNALQAASAGGHDKTVQLLLDNGAEINAQGGHYGNALQAASAGGHDKTVQLLLDNGADVWPGDTSILKRLRIEDTDH